MGMEKKKQPEDPINGKGKNGTIKKCETLLMCMAQKKSPEDPVNG